MMFKQPVEKYTSQKKSILLYFATAITISPAKLGYIIRFLRYLIDQVCGSWHADLVSHMIKSIAVMVNILAIHCKRAFSAEGSYFGGGDFWKRNGATNNGGAPLFQNAAIIGHKTGTFMLQNESSPDAFTNGSWRYGICSLLKIMLNFKARET